MSKNKTSKTTTRKTASRKKTSTVKRTTTKRTPTKNTVTDTTVPENLENSTKNGNAKFLAIALIAIVVIAVYLFTKSTSESETGTTKVEVDRNSPIKTAADVEKVIDAWVQNNPKAILESVIKMQQAEAEKQMNDARNNISSRLKDIYKDKNDPVYDPGKADVTIVEFFDYNCGYCKRAVATLEQLIKNDKKVKIIFKELPILGQASEDLATVSIAFSIIAPKKYFAFHTDLMKSKANTTEKAIEIVKKHGISRAKIQKAIIKHKTKIDLIISKNRELSSSIGVNGTPAFLIGETLFPGAVGISTLQAEIKKNRELKK